MRLDTFLTENGYCDSRNKAKTVIGQNRVQINGKIANKASLIVSQQDEIIILPSSVTEFVGRGGLKLEHALKEFSIDVKGKVCVDIGASTGGFTECLLINGAKFVYAVDSGKGQLSEKLINNPKVKNMESTNARFLTTSDIDENFAQIVTVDVSFISQTLIYPAILSITQKGADVITLIKPQFEAGRAYLDKHGVIKEQKVRENVVKNIISFAQSSGFEYVSHCPSPIVGTSGNIEYLLHLKR